MLTAPIQTEVSYALANLVTVDWEHLVLVSKDPDPVLVIIYLILVSYLNSNFMIYVKMLMSVPLGPITVTTMPPAATLMATLRVLANLALLATEPLVLVSKDPVLYLFIDISGLILYLNFHYVLYTIRCKRVHC